MYFYRYLQLIIVTCNKTRFTFKCFVSFILPLVSIYTLDQATSISLLWNCIGW